MIWQTLPLLFEIHSHLYIAKFAHDIRCEIRLHIFGNEFHHTSYDNNVLLIQLLSNLICLDLAERQRMQLMKVAFSI